MKPEVLIGIVGAVVSAVFMYFPQLNTEFAALETGKKSAIMLAVLAAVSAIIVGLSCTGYWEWITCTQSGLKDFANTLFYILVGNQFFYLIAPEPKAVKEAKETR